MDSYKTFVIFLFSVPLLDASNSTIEEYVKFITEYEAFTQSYVLPTDNSELNHTLDKVNDYGPFDLIIVGGSTTSSLLANRLSQIPDREVLLLEAEGKDNAFSGIPGVDSYMRNIPMNWGYFTTPQKSAYRGMLNIRCSYSTGKVMGGFGALEDMVFKKGNRYYFNRWNKGGNVGWSYKGLLPYFMTHEKIQIPGYNKVFHGHTGEVKINYKSPDPINYDTLGNGNKGPCIQVHDRNCISDKFLHSNTLNVSGAL